MVKPDEAAVIASVAQRKIFEWMEAGKLHYSEKTMGAVVVCLNSLKLTMVGAVRAS